MKRIALCFLVFCFGIVANDSAAQQSLTAPGAAVVKLADGFGFTEGPTANSQGDVYFVDDPNCKIHCWSVSENKVSVFIEESAHANGMFFDKDGVLYVCEGGTSSIVSYTPDGRRNVVANKFGSRHFNKPNDLWIDPKGGIYFTDPVYGQNFHDVQGGEHVYYISPDRGNVIRVIEVTGKEGEFVKPNGVVGTPDGELLYVADINGKTVYRYNIQPDGTLTDKHLFASPYVVDGMTIDENGNIYLADDEVVVCSPEGKEIERIKVPERPSNVCFGGKDHTTLFITARKGLYAIEMNVKGGKDSKDAGDRMVLKIKDVEYAFRWCPPGRFTMGSPSDELGRADNETQHRVTLSRGFWMLETEVTQEMWESVMGNNPSDFKGKKLPVETISWNACQEFVEELNELKVAPAGFKFSLPTESQWEYACRAGTMTAHHFGNSLSAEQANFEGNVGQTRAVGSYPANAWGLKDMHGNVWEWCLDWYGDYPSGAVADPTGADRGSGRVLRGGSWDYDAWRCRSAYRFLNAPSDRSYDFGVRISLVRVE